MIAPVALTRVDVASWHLARAQGALAIAANWTAAAIGCAHPVRQQRLQACAEFALQEAALHKELAEAVYRVSA